jgi:hypothetical protein
MHSITFGSSVLIVSFVRPKIYQVNYDLVTSGLLFLRVICDLEGGDGAWGRETGHRRH